MKEWPPNDQVANGADLCDAIVRAIRFAYSCKRKNEGKSIPLDIPEAPHVPEPRSWAGALDADMLEYRLERGSDALAQIVYAALNVGMEQGRRITMNQEVVALKREVEWLKRDLQRKGGPL